MNKSLEIRPLAATSWLWPTTLAENIRRIAAWELPIAQVALLFYQCRASLAYSAEDFPTSPGLSAHVHLPIDLPWSSGAQAVWEDIARLMELPGSLSPWGGVLHPPDDPDLLAGVASLWRKHAPAWNLMIENIPGQDLRSHWPSITSLDLPICLDVGHLMAFDQHWLLDQPGLSERVELIHCYAPGIVKHRHEHLPLSELSPGQSETLRLIFELIRPDTPVLFEVFSESDLRDSLKTFYALLRDWRLQK
ncbi:MAG: hypothetical protein HY795_10555 [Desulfovibrio sp.]|nr:hypothetical protein [Desulfovibrio sp.]MBI4959743.1 hypothetical protein [Desulfovibrio sp.]